MKPTKRIALLIAAAAVGTLVACSSSTSPNAPGDSGTSDAAKRDATSGSGSGSAPKPRHDAGSSSGSGSGVHTQRDAAVEAEAGPAHVADAGDAGDAAGCQCATGACNDGGCIGATTEATSCASVDGGLNTCGVSGTVSCCTSLEVQGGTFYRTYDLNADAGVWVVPDGGAINLADPATVHGLRIDELLVTVGRFRAFVAAWNGGNGYMPAVGQGVHAYLNDGKGLAAVGDAGFAYEQGWQASYNANVAPTDDNLLDCAGGESGLATWTPTPGENELLPITCENWFEAYAFCIWDGGFLPSEAEWTYTAAGGDQQRTYPWGASLPPLDPQYAIYGCDYPDAGPGVCPMSLSTANVAPVGIAALGAGRWGQLDLGGELFEWLLDSFGSYANPCVDCVNLTSSIASVAHGGTFATGAEFMQPPVRSEGPSTIRYFHGIRCGRAP